MNDFDIVNLNDENIKILIVMKTCDSPFDFVDEIQEQLKIIEFSGIFVIDTLLHSGNNEERFISGFFDGNSFDDSKFRFEKVDKKMLFVVIYVNILDLILKFWIIVPWLINSKNWFLMAVLYKNNINTNNNL